MFSIFNRETIFGTLPKSLNISSILQLDDKSSAIIEVYDTDPNLVARLNADENQIVLKRFGWRNPIHFLISPFMDSRAQKSYNISSKLDSFNIGTPKPLFVYTKRVLGFITENFFVTETVHPHTKFRSFIITENNVGNITKVIEDLAKSIAQMHNSGIIHRDLTSGNFLVDDNYQVYIVDLNRAKHKQDLSVHHRISDLAKIYFKPSNALSQSDAISIFFRSYAAEAGIQIDWIEKYADCRKQMLLLRSRKKRLKKYFRSKYKK